MLISAGVLFTSPINVNFEYNNNFDFKDSQLYRFLNKEFKKDLLLNHYVPNQKTMHL